MAVVSTGFFDGVHLGHRHVIETLVSSARERGEESVVITFAQHPRAVLQQDATTLRLLTSRYEKKELIAALGVDRIVELQFTRQFAALSAAEYLDLLRRDYACSTVVIGYDTRMGCDMCGADAIQALAAARGMEVVRCEACGTVSSTRIRKALSDGRVEDASAMLGYDYSISGVVVPGKRLGRTIGFPTANLRLADPLKMIPAKGVYLTRTEVLGKVYDSMTNVGDIVETNIFGFGDDIYSLGIRVSFVRRLREMKRMGSLEELRAQLAEDRARCLEMIAAADSK